MPKNVTVVDNAGRVLEPTYPKRAHGLVKQGRARYLSENTICLLACSSNNKEEHTMYATDDNIASEAGQPQTGGQQKEGFVYQSDTSDILYRIADVLLDSLNFDLPGNTPPHIHQQVLQHRFQIQQRLCALLEMLGQQERQKSEMPDFAYIQAQIDRLQAQMAHANDSDERDKARRQISALLHHYMALQADAKRQALIDRVVAHAWIDQDEKIEMTKLILRDSATAKPGDGHGAKSVASVMDDIDSILHEEVKRGLKTAERAIRNLRQDDNE